MSKPERDSSKNGSIALDQESQDKLKIKINELNNRLSKIKNSRQPINRKEKEYFIKKVQKITNKIKGYPSILSQVIEPMISFLSMLILPENDQSLRLESWRSVVTLISVADHNSILKWRRITASAFSAIKQNSFSDSSSNQQKTYNILFEFVRILITQFLQSSTENQYFYWISVFVQIIFPIVYSSDQKSQDIFIEFLNSPQNINSVSGTTRSRCRSVHNLFSQTPKGEAKNVRQEISFELLNAFLVIFDRFKTQSLFSSQYPIEFAFYVFEMFNDVAATLDLKQKVLENSFKPLSACIKFLQLAFPCKFKFITNDTQILLENEESLAEKLQSLYNESNRIFPIFLSYFNAIESCPLELESFLDRVQEFSNQRRSQSNSNQQSTDFNIGATLFHNFISLAIHIFSFHVYTTNYQLEKLTIKQDPNGTIKIRMFSRLFAHTLRTKFLIGKILDINLVGLLGESIYTTFLISYNPSTVPFLICLISSIAFHEKHFYEVFTSIYDGQNKNILLTLFSKIGSQFAVALSPYILKLDISSSAPIISNSNLYEYNIKNKEIAKYNSEIIHDLYFFFFLESHKFDEESAISLMKSFINNLSQIDSDSNHILLSITETLLALIKTIPNSQTSFIQSYILPILLSHIFNCKILRTTTTISKYRLEENDSSLIDMPPDRIDALVSTTESCITILKQHNCLSEKAALDWAIVLQLLLSSKDKTSKGQILSLAVRFSINSVLSAFPYSFSLIGLIIQNIPKYIPPPDFMLSFYSFLTSLLLVHSERLNNIGQHPKEERRSNQSRSSSFSIKIKFKKNNDRQLSSNQNSNTKRNEVSKTLSPEEYEMLTTISVLEEFIYNHFDPNHVENTEKLSLILFLNELYQDRPFQQKIYGIFENHFNINSKEMMGFIQLLPSLAPLVIRKVPDCLEMVLNEICKIPFTLRHSQMNLFINDLLLTISDPNFIDNNSEILNYNEQKENIDKSINKLKNLCENLSFDAMQILLEQQSNNKDPKKPSLKFSTIINSKTGPIQLCQSTQSDGSRNPDNSFIIYSGNGNYASSSKIVMVNSRNRSNEDIDKKSIANYYQKIQDTSQNSLSLVNPDDPLLKGNFQTSIPLLGCPGLLFLYSSLTGFGGEQTIYSSTCNTLAVSNKLWQLSNHSISTIPLLYYQNGSNQVLCDHFNQTSSAFRKFILRFGNFRFSNSYHEQHLSTEDITDDMEIDEQFISGPIFETRHHNFEFKISALGNRQLIFSQNHKLIVVWIEDGNELDLSKIAPKKTEIIIFQEIRNDLLKVKLISEYGKSDQTIDLIIPQTLAPLLVKLWALKTIDQHLDELNEFITKKDELFK